MKENKNFTEICLIGEDSDSGLSMDMLESDGFNPFEETQEQAAETADDNQELSIEEELGYKPETDNAETEPKDIFGDKSEKVGEKNNQQGEDTDAKNKNLESSSTISSILSALKADGVLPDVDDTLVNSAKTAEDFATIIEKQVEARLDEAQKRVKEALDSGVPQDEVKMYENAISFLDTITEEKLIEETDESEDLRKRLIYQDYLNKGFKHERALKEVEKSVSAGSDVDDAKSALEANKEFYSKGYEAIKAEKATVVANAQKTREAEKANLQKKSLETLEPFTGVKLDTLTRKQIFDNATKLVEKDADGNLLTPIQKYIKENPVDAQYFISLFYTMTGGFKNIDKIVGKKVAQETKKAFQHVDKVLTSSSSGFADSGNSIFNEENMNALPRLDIS